MNILLLTPGINKKYNDNFYSYKYIADCGNYILALSNRQTITKCGDLEKAQLYESTNNVIIYRIFDTLKEQNNFIIRKKKYRIIKKIVSNFKPHIIFCENANNMPIATQLKKDFNIPILLRLEFLLNKKYPYQMIGKEKLLRNRITGDYLGILFGKIIEKLVCKNADAIITCYFLDLKRKSEFKDKLFFFVPWPTYVPHRYNERKCEHRAIYIGALDSHKNIKEFEKILPEIFAKTPIKEFIFVGTGRDLHLIMELKKKYPDRIILINFLPREECLRLIASSFVAISPAIIGGWGFIGDAWATGTPIIVTHNHYNFKNKMDAIVTSPDNIADSINELYQNPQLYESIINAGYHRFRTHHDAQLIGAKYYEICKLTINKFQRSHERMS